jgi:dethiobiotin synthetase
MIKGIPKLKTIYFITATNTDIGKTKAAEIFLNKYSNEGKKVGYYKPCETGVDDYPLDGSAMLKLTQELNPNFKVNINDIVPYQFKLPAAPYVANVDNIDIDINFLIKKAKYLLDFCDLLIIEGAGGLMVPIKENYFMIDLIKDFQDNFENCKTKLITPSKLGCINDTLLSINALKNKNINFNWYINLYEEKEDFRKTTLPFYKKYFKDNLNYL